ncbi:MAG: hypothetical protein PF542_06280 [Nanoarchaeota archaeon]|jgi:tetratricopeptide (TPR) repeat protein|nr:hypothetical protein [Nanoarchaeota archaeon]
MLSRGMKKYEIEDALADKDDFVQIDYLTKYIKEQPPIDMRKYANLRLARVYLNRAMFVDAAKSFRNAAINSVVFKEQQENCMKEAKCYIRALKFEDAGSALKKAFAEANQDKRNEMYKDFLNYYKKVGEDFEKAGLPGKSTKLYEKLIRMKITDKDKAQVKEKLLALYEKLGKTKEYNFLKSMN